MMVVELVDLVSDGGGCGLSLSLQGIPEAAAAYDDDDDDDDGTGPGVSSVSDGGDEVTCGVTAIGYPRGGGGI
jgi:hypothetical protein